MRTSIKRVRRPDTTIECAPPSPESYEARNPVAVLDVLSPSTRPNDRSVKLQEYMRHPTLRTIVHIDPEVSDVLVYRRGQDGQWGIERFEDAAAVITIDDPAVRMSLAAVDAGVPIAPRADAAEPQP